MSDLRALWVEGQAVDYRELQRQADQAAGAPDRAAEIQMMPGTVSTTTKRVMPLASETASVNPHLLIVPSGTTGKVTAKQAWYGAASSTSGTTAPIILLAHTQYATKDSALVDSNSSGSTKYVAVYGTIARAVTVTGSRPYRDATGVSTQTLNLASETALTLGLTTQYASKAAALAALPSDTATAYTFHLAYITIANGYTSGTAINQSSTGGSTYIEQAWDAGGIDPQRVLGRVSSIYAGVASYKPATPLTARFGSMETFYAGVIIPPAGGTLTIDATIDWRRRFIIVEGAMPYIQSGSVYPGPELVAVAGVKVSAGGGAGDAAYQRPQVFGAVSQASSVGQNFNMGYSGTDAGNFATMGGLGANNNSLILSFYAHGTTGALTLQANGTTYDGANGDNWFFVIRVTPQFVF